MKSRLTKYGCAVFLLGAAAACPAQSTWNFFISDAGGGNSLVTWSVAGDLATPAGSTLGISEPSLVVAVNAPGIYVDSYAADGASQSIPTPDGSYFQYSGASVYLPVVSYYADNAPGDGIDSFGFLSSPLLPRTGPGYQFSYNPGTQSALIPIEFSDFNPGTYQSLELEYDTPFSVTLVVESEPEPSALALSAVGGLLLFGRRKQRQAPGCRRGE